MYITSKVAPRIPGASTDDYRRRIRRIPMLTQDEERALACRCFEGGDLEAANHLTIAHLPLVARIASSYRRYRTPLTDLIGEGNLGLVKAVRTFDPDRGFRLSSYAMWAIKAAIQTHIMENWSIVKMGTTKPEKKIFFRLDRLELMIGAIDDGDLNPDHLARVARMLGVPEHDVVSMRRRILGADGSLNTPRYGYADSGDTWMDLLPDHVPNQEERIGERQEHQWRIRKVTEALTCLSPRQLRIFTARRLQDPPTSLEALGEREGCAKQDVFKIEQRAHEKFQRALRVVLADVRFESRHHALSAAS